MHALEQLLEGLHTSFPECLFTAQVYANYRSVVMPSADLRERTVREWHAALGNHYVDFDNHNLDGLEKAEIPLIGILDVFKKYRDPDLGEENRQILWEYLEQLNAYAKLYV